MEVRDSVNLLECTRVYVIARGFSGSSWPEKWKKTKSTDEKVEEVAPHSSTSLVHIRKIDKNLSTTMSTVACELNSSYYTTAIGNSALDGFSGNFSKDYNTLKMTH